MVALRKPHLICSRRERQICWHAYAAMTIPARALRTWLRSRARAILATRSRRSSNSKEKVERLTNLIGIFENKALDFSKNRADGDDILGDAHCDIPAEVSRVIPQVIGMRDAHHCL
jgi:hypothetical protein